MISDLQYLSAKVTKTNIAPKNMCDCLALRRPPQRRESAPPGGFFFSPDYREPLIRLLKNAQRATY